MAAPTLNYSCLLTVPFYVVSHNTSIQLNSFGSSSQEFHCWNIVNMLSYYVEAAATAKNSHLMFTVVYVSYFLQLMKTMGLRNGVIWWSWFINTYLGMLLMTIVATIFRMVGRVLFVSNGLIVFIYQATFSLSTTMFW